MFSFPSVLTKNNSRRRLIIWILLSYRAIYDGLNVKECKMTDALLRSLSGGEDHDFYDILSRCIKKIFSAISSERFFSSTKHHKIINLNHQRTPIPITLYSYHWKIVPWLLSLTSFYVRSWSAIKKPGVPPADTRDEILKRYVNWVYYCFPVVI